MMDHIECPVCFSKYVKCIYHSWRIKIVFKNYISILVICHFISLHADLAAKLPPPPKEPLLWPLSIYPLVHIAALSSLTFLVPFLLLITSWWATYSSTFKSPKSLFLLSPWSFCFFFYSSSLQQQLQAQHLSQHAQGLPMGPHPSGLSHPGLALGGGSSLLALSGALGAQLAAKDERAHLEAAAAAAAAAEHHRGTGAL